MEFYKIYPRLNSDNSTIFIRSHIFSRGLNIYLYIEDLDVDRFSKAKYRPDW